MLKPSILYKAQLTDSFAMASIDPSNKYFSDTYWSFESDVYTSNYNGHQFTSVDHYGNIVGFLGVTVDRGCHYVHSLACIRFLKDKKYDILFAKDIKKFFVMMFCQFKYNKLSFSVCVGSPHENMYDRFIQRYNGRVVGIMRNQFRTTDGEIHDTKFYEIMREDLLTAAGMQDRI